MKLGMSGIAATLCLAALTSASVALAQTSDRGALPEKHDSNTLHKLGKSIQYPFRKAGENTSKTAQKAGKATQYSTRKSGEHASVATHQATGQKSIIRRREKGVNRVVTPSGKLKTMKGKTIK